MALILASRNGNVQRVKELLSVGSGAVEVNFRDVSGYTALMLASCWGHLEIVKELLSVESIDVNLQNNYGSTALIWASGNGLLEIVKLLLSVESGAADANIQNKRGDTALILASKYGHLETVKLLLATESGAADVNLQDNHGDTALSFASYRSYLEIVKELVKKGAQIDAKSIQEWSDDSKMLMKLSLQQRCWLTVLINRIDYTGSIPPIISHIHNVIWLEGDDGTKGTGVWAQGYVIRMRKKILWIF